MSIKTSLSLLYIPGFLRWDMGTKTKYVFLLTRHNVTAYYFCLDSIEAQTQSIICEFSKEMSKVLQAKLVRANLNLRVGRYGGES